MKQNRVLGGVWTAAAVSLALAAAGCDLFVDKNDSVEVAVTLQEVSSNGTEGTLSTTALTLTFDKAIEGLAAADITLSGLPGVEPAALSGGENGVYTLPLTGVSAAGTLTVAVHKAGYAITGSPSAVAIHYAPVAVPITSVTVTGPDSVTKGGSAVFKAMVNGAESTAVTWLVTESAINAIKTGTGIKGGVLTVSSSETLKELTVQAVSTADAGKSGEMRVRVVVIQDLATQAAIKVESSLGTEEIKAALKTVPGVTVPDGFTVESADLDATKEGIAAKLYTIGNAPRAENGTVAAALKALNDYLENPFTGDWTGNGENTEGTSLGLTLVIKETSWECRSEEAGSWKGTYTHTTSSGKLAVMGVKKSGAEEWSSAAGEGSMTVTGDMLTLSLDIRSEAEVITVLVSAPLERLVSGAALTLEQQEEMALIADMMIVGSDSYLPTDKDGIFPGGRNVTLSAFKIAKYETTYELWNSIKVNVKAEGYTFAEGREGYDGTHGESVAEAAAAKTEPVTNVSWWDVIVWCNAYSAVKGKMPVYYSDESFEEEIKDASFTDETTVYVKAEANGYRLPTEAEWEAAARGGNPSDKTTWGLVYAGAGNDGIDDVAWYWGNSGDGMTYTDTGYGTHPVGRKEANSAGLYDMSGNVQEWCFDWYESPIPVDSDTAKNPAGAATGTYRTKRGGSWHPDAENCSVSYRRYSKPDYASGDLGFRVVCAP